MTSRKSLGFPSTRGIADRPTAQYLDKVREQLELREGLRNNPGQRAVTYDELVGLQDKIGELEIGVQVKIESATKDNKFVGRPDPVKNTATRIGLGAVDTENLSARAVTNVVQSAIYASMALNDVNQTIGRATLQTTERVPLLIMFNALLEVNVNASAAGTGWIALDLVRDGTVIKTVPRVCQTTTAGGYNAALNQTFFEVRLETPPPGRHTYEMRARRETGGSALISFSATAADRNIILLALKR